MLCRPAFSTPSIVARGGRRKSFLLHRKRRQNRRENSALTAVSRTITDRCTGYPPSCPQRASRWRKPMNGCVAVAVLPHLPSVAHAAIGDSRGSGTVNIGTEANCSAPRSRRTMTGTIVADCTCVRREPTMPRFAANLSFLFDEVPFLERFGEAAHGGFRAVEFAFG